ncbi:MAG: Uncharacterised protein [Hyphomonas sp. TMED17]|nr:MAG: Uncharacterised protein [Hyphomonas sp. TMED17]
MLKLYVGSTLALIAACSSANIAENSPCEPVSFRDDAYIICRFDAGTDDIQMFHSDASGQPYSQFDRLSEAMAAQNKTLVFAMNGGMYHEDRQPVGYYQDRYGERAMVNTNDGPGNFHLKPNGVFWLNDGSAGILESQRFLDAGITADYASQSGPMLVIDGELHPQINPEGRSRKRRNGVGVAADNQTVIFAISDEPVSFFEFSSLFKDMLGTPNALYLDGQVSRLYAPNLKRNETGPDLGPFVGVIANTLVGSDTRATQPTNKT